MDDFDLTVEEGLKQLTTICSMEVEGERPQGTLSEDTTPAITITRTIRGIADKVA